MYVSSDKYTRFCQWKNLELNIQVHRIKTYPVFLFLFQGQNFRD